MNLDDNVSVAGIAKVRDNPGNVENQMIEEETK